MRIARLGGAGEQRQREQQQQRDRNRTVDSDVHGRLLRM